MQQVDGFEELLTRTRAGDAAAAETLVRRFEPAVRRVARIRLKDSGLQRSLESIDICQSVLGSFFVRASLGEYELKTADDLLKLLAQMTRNKVVGHARYNFAARRDQRRVRSDAVEDHRGDIGEAGGRTSPAPADPSPSPANLVATKDLLNHVMAKLSPDERKLAELRAQQMDWNAIAKEFDGSAEALRKRLTRAVDRVAKELEID